MYKTSLALFITPIATTLHNSIVFFMQFKLVLLTSALSNVPELYQVWQSSLGAHHCCSGSGAKC